MADPADRMMESIEGQARDWVARLASGEMGEQELARFRLWRDQAPGHDLAFRRERAFWQDLGVVEAAFAPQQGARRPAIRRGFGAAALAASVAALLAVPSVMLWWQADHRSPHGVVSSVDLPDGSLAMLDGDSAIAVDFGKGQRRVRLLRGRAWFSVRHGDTRPFRVEASDGAVQDLGTAFDAEQGADGLRVGVTEGRVMLRGEGGGALRLQAGQRALAAPGAAPRRLPDEPAGDIAGWRHGEILLRATPLPEAIAAIAHYRGAPVFTLGDLSHADPVSGVFRADHTEDALATLIAMRGLTVIRLPGGILLLRAPATR